jgi:DNA oxidative demethylase
LQAAPRRYDNGLVHVPSYLSAAGQRALLAEIEAAIAAAPLFRPCMPKTGRPFSVKMTNCGTLGWVSDPQGYRYQPAHPKTGKPWPAIPRLALDAWEELGFYAHPPEACLVNVYDLSAHMGLHQDRDEEDFAAPVVSLSLGCSCIFRFGATTRGGRTQSLELASGDALVLGGESRLAYHGVARIIPGSSNLLARSRINLTLRRVTTPGRSKWGEDTRSSPQ